MVSDAKREYLQQWRKENAERVRAANRAYYALHGADINARRADAKAAWAADNRERVRESAAASRARNREAYNARARSAYAVDSSKQQAYRAANAEVLAAKAVEYRSRNRTKQRALSLRHYYANKGDYILRARLREQHIVAYATPSWADTDAINAFYAACPAGHHVDHIVPLRGKSVSGLHVLANLQYLSATDNLAKGNRHGD